MAHALETDETGTTYFADSRTDAWHQLGQQFGRTMTAAELMTESHLGGWNVRKAPVQTLTEDGILEVPGKYATVRTNPSTGKAEALGGVVGEFYTPIQNEANTDVLQLIVDESGAIFETAGSLNGGRNTFVTMKLPETMTVGGSDTLDLYIAALNSHDGTSAFTLLVSPVRIVCANTQAAALRNFQSKFSISHTVNAVHRIDEARTALRLSHNYLEAFQAEAEAMISAEMNKDQFVKLTRSIWAKPTTPKGEAASRKATSHANRENVLIDLFSNSETNAGIRNTAWAGYQSIVEYVDHFQNVQLRGGKFGNVADARATRVIMGTSNVENVKLAAFQKTMAFAAR